MKCVLVDVVVVIVVVTVAVVAVVPDYVDKIALTAGGGKQAAHPADICSQLRLQFPELWFSFSFSFCVFGLPTQSKYENCVLCEFSISWHFGIMPSSHNNHI